MIVIAKSQLKCGGLVGPANELLLFSVGDGGTTSVSSALVVCQL